MRRDRLGLRQWLVMAKRTRKCLHCIAERHWLWRIRDGLHSKRPKRDQELIPGATVRCDVAACNEDLKGKICDSEGNEIPLHWGSSISYEWRLPRD
jgi:hypothetical protein